MGEEVKEKKPNKIGVAFKEFFRFLYNPDDHTVLGRGGESWGKQINIFFGVASNTIEEHNIIPTHL